MRGEKDITVATWAEQWFTQRVGKWNLKTEGGYRNLIYNHIIPGVGRMGLGDLTVRRIQSFYKRLVQDGLSTRSVWCIHLLLRRILDEACWDGSIEYNPAELCEIPQSARHETVTLRLGQLQRYLKVAEALDAFPILYIGLTSGLRQCELLTLLWADFDFRRKCILRGKRMLILNERASALLTQERDHHTKRPEVFLNSKTGRPYQLHEFYYLHRKVLKAARLPWVAFRDLARLCQEAGL